MVPTEVNSVLILLKEQEPLLWFGKSFLHDFAMKSKTYGSITVNYPDIETLGKALGKLVSKGYPCRNDGTPVYRFELGRTGVEFLELRVHKRVEVVDFDRVCYNPVKQALFYLTTALPEKKLEAFRNKTCTLLFDPCSEEKDERVWMNRQSALLPYVNKCWKILDANGTQIEFAIPGSDYDYLDPRVKWVALNKIVTPTEEDLSHENFVRELDQLLVKYGMKPSTTPK